MRRVLFGLLAAFGCMLVVVPPVEAQVQADLIVVDLEGLADGEIRRIAEKAPSTLVLSARPTVETRDPTELGDINEQVLKARGLAAAPVSRLCGQRQDVNALMATLDEAWLFADLMAAGEAIAKLETAAICGGEPLGKRALGLLYYHKGLEAIYGGGERGSEYFHAAMGIWPKLAYPIDENSDVKLAFDQARTQLMASANVRVTVDLSSLMGLTLLVDGEPIPGSEMILPGGPHYLQVATASGAILYGEVTQLEKAATDDAVAWPPEGLGVGGSGGLGAALRVELTQPLTGPSTLATARGLLEETGATYVVFAGMLSPNTIRARWVGGTGFLGDMALRRAPPPEPRREPFGGRSSEEQGSGDFVTVKPSRMGVGVAVGLAAVSAGSATAYGLLYRQVEQQVYGDPLLAERRVKQGLTAEGVAIGAAVGAVIAGGLTWARKKRNPYGGYRVYLLMDPQSEAEGLALGLGIGGSWQ